MGLLEVPLLGEPFRESLNDESLGISWKKKSSLLNCSTSSFSLISFSDKLLRFLVFVKEFAFEVGVDKK